MKFRKRVMSDALKDDIAKELGIYEIAKEQGYGVVSSRNCGNLVKKAIERANQTYH